MTKVHQILLVILCLSIHSAAWCQSSTKGNWTKEDKLSTIAELNVQREVFEAFLDSSQIDPLIDCIADELERTFENPDAVDTSSDTIQAISVHCLNAVGFNPNPVEEESTSVKGNWDKQDIAKAKESLEMTRGTMNELMEPIEVDILFECILSKLEDTYTNFDEALEDPNDGISSLTMDCVSEKNIFDPSEMPDESSLVKEEVGDPNSSVGNWSDADKVLLEEQLLELRPSFEKQIGTAKSEHVFECVRFNFENAFENYAAINNHPEIYKAILDECYKKGQ